MTFKELKKLVAEKIKEYPEYKERAIKELKRAKWADEDGINIADMILNSDKKCDNRYVLPFFLGKTTEVNLEKPLEVINVKGAGTGGLDIDVDYMPSGKEELKKWLIEKYGEDRVLSVAAYGTVGMASAIKDVLRKAEVPFKDSNAFCKELNDEISFEENMKNYKEKFPELYEIYERNKVGLDMVPKMIGQINHISVHAAGTMVLDKPVWNYIPVVHTKDGLATAFVESGSAAELDSLNLIKADVLAITVLETIFGAIDMIDEPLVRIIDDDGIEKIVPISYTKNNEETNN